MAEYNTAQIFRGASGWLSDDIFTGITDSFYDWANLEIRENAKWISISKAMVKDSGTAITEKINVIVKTGDAQWVSFGNSGGIYVKNAWVRLKAASWTPVQPITWASVFGTYLYWATTTGLHRILVTNIATWTGEVLNWNTTLSPAVTINSAAYHPMKATSTILAIGNGNIVTRVWIAGDLLDVVTLDTNTVIKIINEIWGTIRLYCSKGKDLDVIYLWDWLKTVPDQVIPLEWFLIYQAIIFEWVDYVVTNRGIWYIDWYKWIAMKKTTIFNANLNSICVYNEKIYVWWLWGTYVFWAKNKNYPNVLNFEHYTSDNSLANEVWAMTSNWTDCFVSWTNNVSHTYWIDLLSTTTYGTWAYYIARGFYGSSLAEIKGWLYIRLWFKPLITGQQITVSYSLNGWSYVPLNAITPTSDKKTSWTTHQKLNGQFQYILFKVTLVWPGTSTPEFYNLDFYYDTMLD